MGGSHVGTESETLVQKLLKTWPKPRLCLLQTGSPQLPAPSCTCLPRLSVGLTVSWVLAGLSEESALPSVARRAWGPGRSSVTVAACL